MGRLATSDLLWSMLGSRSGLRMLLGGFLFLFLVFPSQVTESQQGGIFSHLGPTQPTVLQPQQLPTRDQLSPPRRARPKHVNSVQIKSDANKLAALAQKIPVQVNRIQNVYPKDLPTQLKQIEKLSKRLRREISQ
jgi:hypothetical protein